MSDAMLVRPSKPGLIIRFPQEPWRVLKDDGESVPRSSYWIRRVREGSVTRMITKPTKKDKQS